MTTFDSTVESLPDLLRSIRAGKTQLPDFQRGWVWDDAHIRSLLASVSLAYPIGAVMMLQAGNPNVRFQSRPVEGASPPSACNLERLILDGQQRLTALFQALFMGSACLHPGRPKESRPLLVLPRHRQGPRSERRPRGCDRQFAGGFPGPRIPQQGERRLFLCGKAV
jgi:hypothetical protein